METISYNTSQPWDPKSISKTKEDINLIVRMGGLTVNFQPSRFSFLRELNEHSTAKILEAIDRYDIRIFNRDRFRLERDTKNLTKSILKSEELFNRGKESEENHKNLVDFLTYWKGNPRVKKLDFRYGSFSQGFPSRLLDFPLCESLEFSNVTLPDINFKESNLPSLKTFKAVLSRFRKFPRGLSTLKNLKKMILNPRHLNSLEPFLYKALPLRSIKFRTMMYFTEPLKDYQPASLRPKILFEVMSSIYNQEFRAKIKKEKENDRLWNHFLSLEDLADCKLLTHLDLSLFHPQFEDWKFLGIPSLRSLRLTVLKANPRHYLQELNPNLQFLHLWRDTLEHYSYLGKSDWFVEGLPHFSRLFLVETNVALSPADLQMLQQKGIHFLNRFNGFKMEGKDFL